MDFHEIKYFRNGINYNIWINGLIVGNIRRIGTLWNVRLRSYRGGWIFVGDFPHLKQCREAVKTYVTTNNPKL